MLSLDIGASGMLAQQQHVNVISNNIANMTTIGFKRQRAEFRDLIYQNVTRPGATSSDTGTVVPAGIQIGLGVKAGSVYRLHEQGAMEQTGNMFDLAVSGKGFFQVELPSGETAYTRAGNFAVNGDGTLVTQQGYTVSPAISIPDDAIDVVIDESGQVSVKIAGQSSYQNVGQLQLARFINPAGLDAIGDNFLLETEASGAPTTGTANSDSFGKIDQGFREASNVNVVEEITDLIAAQRAYEMNSKVIQTSDQMLNSVTQLR